MAWIIFGISAFLLAVLFVPFKYWKKLWVLGITGMIIIYFIDSALIKLGAFEFIYNGTKVNGLPFPYWISYFLGGIFFAYYRPSKTLLKVFYVIVSAFFLLILEFIMIQVGAFQHLNWGLLNAYILNIGGFIIFLWISELFPND